MVDERRQVDREVEGEHHLGPIPWCGQASTVAVLPALDREEINSETGVTWDYTMMLLGVEPCKDVLHPSHQWLQQVVASQKWEEGERCLHYYQTAVGGPAFLER